jgi:hypothetical protein
MKWPDLLHIKYCNTSQTQFDVQSYHHISVGDYLSKTEEKKSLRNANFPTVTTLNNTGNKYETKMTEMYNFDKAYILTVISSFKQK